jgi:hypothetical protein
MKMKLAVILALLMLLSSAATAQEHKIDFATVLKDAYDRDFEPVCMRTDDADRNKCLERTTVTLGFICVSSLGASLDTDRNEDFRKKLEREDLARRIARSEKEHAPIGLRSEDLVLLKERIGKTRPSAILVGAAIRQLEPGEAAALSKEKPK